MAAQGMERREILRVLALLAAGASGVPWTPPVGVCLRSRRAQCHYARHRVHAEVLTADGYP